MLLSAKAFFDDKTQSNVRLLIRSQETIPAKWLIEYRKAARGAVGGVIATPKKTGALRRSIITRQIGNQAEVSWRLPYARPQNDGRHTVGWPVIRNIKGHNKRDGGFGIIKGGVTYFNYKYTTPGTGPGFARAAYEYANSQLAKIAREEGLTK